MSDTSAPTPAPANNGPWWAKIAQQSPAGAVVIYILWIAQDLLNPLADGMAKMLLTCTGSAP